MSQRMFLAACLFLITLGAGFGCVQYPTEKQSVVDQRPQITFRFDPSDVRLSEARVLVDDLDSGRLGNFVEGSGALRVLSGSHTVRVVNGSSVLLNERIYVGDGVVRPFIIN